MKYLTLTNENIISMKKDEFNLIEAPTGNGKTTAVIRDLGGYCEEHTKTMLYLVPRTTLKEQLEYKYGAAKHITFKTYQNIGTKIKNNNFTEHYDYIILDEAHMLLTASYYDFSCYKLVNYINAATESIIVGLTATPDPLHYLIKKGLLNKKINPLDVETYDNSHYLNKIYLVRNKANFVKVQKKALESHYKLFNLTYNIFSHEKFKKLFSGYKCATFLAKGNKFSFYFQKEKDDEVLKSIIEHEHMPVDAISTTSVLELGVSIQADSDFLVSFKDSFMPHVIEQFKSRIRFKDDKHKLDMLFQIKNKRSAFEKYKSLHEKIEESSDMYKEYKTFEEILKHNPSDKEEGLGIEYELNKEDNYERFNHVANAYLEYELEYYLDFYSFDSAEEFYYHTLSKMYPNTKIEVIESADLYDLESLLESYLEGAEEVTLLPADIEILKVELIELHLDKSHPYRKVGKKRLNDYLVENYMPYTVENGKPYINPETKKRESTWIIKRTAE